MRLALGLLTVRLIFGGVQPPEFRLPATVKPQSYALDLTLRPSRAAYQGHVEIDLELTAATSLIWLNIKDLAVESAWIEASGARQSARAANAAGEFLGLSFAASVGPGKARLGIAFSGKLDEHSPVGAYRRSQNNNWYVFTSFTAIDARRAFPCFDQPEFKTPWSVTLHVPQIDTAVANSPAVSEAPENDGLKRVTFAKTAPLPSELVAFAVGPFDIVDDGLAGRNRVPVRIIAPKGRGAEAAGALGATRNVLSRLEDYTGIAYPWQKLDHIALLDMPFGATENPGLITYRDSLLLAKGERNTAEHRQGLRATMAHELAHQWFGNLVTQRWWDDVWLSEGFATWLGEKMTDLDFPEAERGVAAVESRIRIMEVDNRPVRVEMHSRKEMEQVYSRIVYQKGAGVLRMVEQWLGEEPFQRGLRKYLVDHANGNATTADLAAALRSVTGVDVAPVLASYLNQPGFPVIHATVDCAGRQAMIRQKSKLHWNTPVCVRGKCTLLTGAAGVMPLDVCPSWPNAEGAGYYRVESDDLGSLLRSGWKVMTAAERLSVVGDVEELPPAAQMKVLPALLRDHDAHVAAEAGRAALRLAASPDVDREAVKKLVP